MTHSAPQAASSAAPTAVRSGAVGSMLEFYDFFIYTQAAALVFPTVFFPSSSPSMAIIASLGTFGVGYLARPVGAFVLGALADHKGRRFALILTMALMSASTLALGLLPTYEQVGIAAPILLVTCRLIQGFAVAGEISGSSTLIVEHAPVGHRGVSASATLQGAQFGQIVAALIFIPLTALMPHGAFVSWGWRVPFLASLIVTLIGMRARLKTVESAAPRKARTPLAPTLKSHAGTVARVLVMSLANIIPVTATVYGASLATQEAYGVGWSDGKYLLIPVLGNVAAVVVIPHVARLSDRVGRRPVIIAGIIAAGVCSYAYLWAVVADHFLLALLLSLVMWGGLYQGYNAVFPAFFPEQFPSRVRVTGMAIGQNIGTALSSLAAMGFAALCPPGTSPTAIVLMIGSLTLATTLLVAAAAHLSPETHRVPASGLGDPTAAPLPEEEYLRVRASAASPGIFTSIRSPRPTTAPPRKEHP